MSLTACVGLEPATLNDLGGPERPDSEVALIREVTGLKPIDGAAVPERPEADRSYYRDIQSSFGGIV